MACGKIKACMPLLLSLVLGSANAGCLEEFKPVIDINYSHKEINWVGAACKYLASGDYVAFAIPVRNGGEVDLDVFLLNPKNRKIVAATSDSGALTDEAIRFAGASIDTAKYEISKGVRAFGVRVDWVGQSQPNPYSSQSLNLYILRGGELVKVLSGLRTYEYSGEWDMHCSGAFNKKSSTIYISPTTDGYHELKIKEDSVDIKAVDGLDGCRNTYSNKTTLKHLIKMKGGDYFVPPELRSLR
ncbi:hypothetical protein SAMN05216189_10117 [Pseudomonas delhiensis]|uniref:Lipoprotein n=1 Tax=Pseudomonas delhiensis TaxID=366289 RepID=A0A239JYN2_9PSED|nr:hypothetical protein [Pseudomonas delhiensis]SDI97490.1 hypothetical protein SAMN05216189_10117 [Pseudomonas delhiensis]SNT10739.1 hypothetical protein SAMN06295949_1147 [Pseudomonas delhiensis]